MEDKEIIQFINATRARIKNNRSIAAIKIIRKEYRLGLKEALDAIKAPKFSINCLEQIKDLKESNADMLAALEMIDDAYGDACECVDPHTPEHCPYCVVREAIRKARGTP